MIRKYCDWCGKEVEDINSNYTLKRESPLIFFEQELCSKCFKEINKLKKKLNAQNRRKVS